MFNEKIRADYRTARTHTSFENEVYSCRYEVAADHRSGIWALNDRCDADWRTAAAAELLRLRRSNSEPLQAEEKGFRYRIKDSARNDLRRISDLLERRCEAEQSRREFEMQRVRELPQRQQEQAASVERSKVWLGECAVRIRKERREAAAVLCNACEKKERAAMAAVDAASSICEVVRRKVASPSESAESNARGQLEVTQDLQFGNILLNEQAHRVMLHELMMSRLREHRFERQDLERVESATRNMESSEESIARRTLRGTMDTERGLAAVRDRILHRSMAQLAEMEQSARERINSENCGDRQLLCQVASAGAREQTERAEDACAAGLASRAVALLRRRSDEVEFERRFYNLDHAQAAGRNTVEWLETEERTAVLSDFN
eukprot:TRINITY_DN17567_c1_g1_i1.p1 TRINITY_DN17567_c1_g1~~TRINITY_DN17567_c1_g1_i1.p1  ORF type:complete len:394 (+),score=51.81 TRINITY_DN17567_c1_g1_i1:46-1182(+)